MQRDFDNKSEAGGSVRSAATQRLEQALVDVPDNIALEEFKHQVKMWMELDNQLKQQMQFIKEKKLVQKTLTQKILGFMAKYNIEDLNTREGKLRYKVTQNKPTVKKQDAKTKLYNFFEHDKELAEKVVKSVFEPEDHANKIERVSLRRLKGVRVMNV